MRLAIVGSRSINSIKFEDYIDSVPDVIVSGGAVGIDSLAENYASAHGIETLIFKPEYSKYGRSAPIRRNEKIVLAADIVLAFWDGRSRGTLSSINFARKHGVDVRIVRV